MGAPLLCHRGGQQQASNRHHDRKLTPAHQVFHLLTNYERPGAMGGAPNRHDRDDQRHQTRAPQAKAQSTPNDEGKDGERRRVVAMHGQFRRPKYLVTDNHECGDHAQDLGNFQRG